MYLSVLYSTPSSPILSNAMTFVMEMEKTIVLLTTISTLGEAKIIKPMNKWICDYCAMGKEFF